MSKFNIDDRIGKIPIPKVAEPIEEKKPGWVLFDSDKYDYSVLVGQKIIVTVAGHEKNPMLVKSIKNLPDIEFEFECLFAKGFAKRWTRRLSEMSNIKWMPIDTLEKRGFELLNNDVDRFEITKLKEDFDYLTKDYETLKLEITNLKNEYSKLKESHLALIQFVKKQQNAVQTFTRK